VSPTQSASFHLATSRGSELCVTGVDRLCAWWNDLSPGHLREAVSRIYPDEAAAFVENATDWRGCLQPHELGRIPDLELPDHPVIIDGEPTSTGTSGSIAPAGSGRARADRWNDPEFQAARIVIADHTTALAAILRLDHRFGARP